MFFLKELRTENKMSQEELAAKVGTTAASICRYESGKRNIPLKKAKELAEVFNVSWQHFYDER